MAAQQTFPNSRPRWVSLASSESPSFSIGVQQAGVWNRMGNSSLAFSDDGRVSINNVQNHSRWRRIFDFSYPLHAAKFDWPLRFLLSLVGLAFTLLCAFGAGSYLKRK